VVLPLEVLATVVTFSDELTVEKTHVLTTGTDVAMHRRKLKTYQQSTKQAMN